MLLLTGIMLVCQKMREIIISVLFYIDKIFIHKHFGRAGSKFTICLLVLHEGSCPLPSVVNEAIPYTGIIIKRWRREYVEAEKSVVYSSSLFVFFSPDNLYYQQYFTDCSLPILSLNLCIYRLVICIYYQNSLSASISEFTVFGSHF